MHTPLKWGVILAGAILLWTLVIHLLGIYTTRVEYASTADTVVIVVPLVILTLAIVEDRRKRDGQISFWSSVLIGVLVAAVSAPITVAGHWFYHHYVNPEWLSILIAYEEQSLTAAGTPPDQIAARVTQLQQGGSDAAQIVGGLIGTVIMGFIVSMLISAVLTIVSRRSRTALPDGADRPHNHA